MKKFTTAEIRDLFNQVMLGEISLSRMVEFINERVGEAEDISDELKDGDFVVNEAGSILIFRKKDENKIYDHAFLGGGWLLFTNLVAPSFSGIKRYATEEEKQKLLDALAKEGKRWNEEKKCIEDIPKRRFRAGDKVKIKDGISSETHRGVSPGFVNAMDKFIGKELTVKEYSSRGWVVFYGDEYEFAEDWLEPYVEELKEGDLAIFWDDNKETAMIDKYDYFIGDSTFPHRDHRGIGWKNVIKFESKEQFEKLIKGEI